MGINLACDCVEADVERASSSLARVAPHLGQGEQLFFIRDVECIETAKHCAQAAFQAAGVEFIDENGGDPGVRLRKGQSHGKRK
jgi:hypothetical protein